MLFERMRRHRLMLPLATLLLLCQAAGGGVVALAHAADASAGPVALESGHTARCPMLHDEVRCALCQYVGAHVIAPATTVAPPTPSDVRWSPVLETRLPPFAARIPSAPPRAPPAFSA